MAAERCRVYLEVIPVSENNFKTLKLRCQTAPNEKVEVFVKQIYWELCILRCILCKRFLQPSNII